MKLYEAAVKKPVGVLICLITLFVMGLISAYKLPNEFLPRIELPFIGVYIPYRNSHPEFTERNIVKPVEEVMATLGGVKSIFSNAGEDDCFIGVEFDWGREVNVLRMEVKEKIDQIRNDLPNDIEHMQIFTFDTNDIPILEGRISAMGRDLSGSYDLIERSVLNPIKRIEGVGAVNIDGVEPKEVAIYLNLDKLKAHRVDVDGLFRQLQGSNMNASAGEITADGLRYSIRSVGSFNSFDQIENLVVNAEGLKLKDIATIYFGEPTVTYGRFLNGEKAVAFWIQKASNANTVEVARRVAAAMEKMNHDPALEGLNVLLFFDQSEEILHGLRTTRQAGIIGSIFAIMVLFFFLRRMTTTLIVAIAIPFSVICTLAFLYFTGRTLNMLTMMGLMLGIGMLVDNAIVVLESIFRHQSRGVESRKAAVIGAREVATAVTAATLTSVIVFAPIVFGSTSDELFVWLSSVGVTISVAILFSLLISLTLIPFLTSRFLKPKTTKPSVLLEKTLKKYVTTLRWTTIRHPKLTLFVFVPLILAITIGGGVVFKIFEPDIESEILIKRIYMRYEFSDNLDYKNTREYVKYVEKALYDHEDELELETVYSYYQDNHAGTTVYFRDKYLDKKKLKEKRKKLREIVPEMAGVKISLGDDEGQSSGGATTIAVNLFGEDKQALDVLAEEVKRRFQYLDDFDDVKTSVEMGREQIQIKLDRELASRYSLTADGITGIMNLTFRGVLLNRFQTPEREVPMFISLDPSDRVGIYNLENLLVGMQEDREITLGSVAEFQETRGPSRIQRRNQVTTVSVQGLYDGEEQDEVMRQITAIMDSIEYPIGYYWSYSSRIQERQQQKSQMGANALLAVVCVYMLMAALFESLLHPLVIMMCLPLAAVGVVLIMVATQTKMGLMAMIGIVVLIGVVVNNGIVLIDHINNYRKKGLSINDAVIEGGRERFRPIVMTAATTVLGLLPMAIGDAHVGQAKYYPLARAVMGGLISSTFLTLLVLPTFYVFGENVKNHFARIWIASRPVPRVALAGAGRPPRRFSPGRLFRRSSPGKPGPGV
jgi:HAE1 family hydrophobic/amphiphilic exporter-1